MKAAIVATLLAGAFALAAAFLIGGRYEMLATSGAITRLDRWTGEIAACDGRACAVVVPAGSRPDPWGVVSQSKPKG